MKKPASIDHWHIKYLASLVRLSPTRNDLQNSERFMLGYLAAIQQYKIIKSREYYLLRSLLKNARVIREKELDKFEKKQSTPHTPAPWLRGDSA